MCHTNHKKALDNNRMHKTKENVLYMCTITKSVAVCLSKLPLPPMLKVGINNLAATIKEKSSYVLPFLAHYGLAQLLAAYTV